MPEDDRTVTRMVELDAAPDEVWEAVADPERRADWLDDDDAQRRVTRIDDTDACRHLSWTWWDPDDAAGASHVDIALTELDSGGTRLVVTEQPLVTQVTARASAGAGRASAWDYRLLGLELLLLPALCGA